ncbi:MAG: MarR family transcriptional regulator [Candidatus Omnitrophota bacterium]
MVPMPINDFADQINEIAPAIMRDLAKRQVCELFKGRITLPQLLVLDFLDAKGASKMKDLALFMNVSTAAVTGIVERLVRDNYVSRSYDPKDRRIIRVNLTNKGSELFKKINRERRQIIVKIFSKISEADRQNYLRILLEIKEILAKGKC